MRNQVMSVERITGKLPHCPQESTGMPADYLNLPESHGNAPHRSRELLQAVRASPALGQGERVPLSLTCLKLLSSSCISSILLSFSLVVTTTSSTEQLLSTSTQYILSIYIIEQNSCYIGIYYIPTYMLQYIDLENQQYYKQHEKVFKGDSPVCAA
jgi:hypothetical protein